MTTLEQVQDNVASMDPFIPLSTTEQDTLARALDVFKAQKLAPWHGLQVLHALPRRGQHSGHAARLERIPPVW